MDSELESALSHERFARYREWAVENRDRALALYALNTQDSESLFTPLQMLVVSLRNRIHSALSDAMHESWFEKDGFLEILNQRDHVVIARDRLVKFGKEPRPGRIVASLSFSFWTLMLARNYEDHWQKTLNRIARRNDGKNLRRKDLSEPLARIRLFRNRIAHHEPVIQFNLPEEYGNIMQITRWLSPVAAEWSERQSRFLQVHRAERIALAKPT